VVIKEIMRPVLFVPASRKIGSLLKEFQLKHIQLAVVINEYGGRDPRSLDLNNIATNQCDKVVPEELVKVD